MVLDRATGQWRHKRFFEIVDELRAGDVLVMNDTKVFRARLHGHAYPMNEASSRPVPARRQAGSRRDTCDLEVFLLRPHGEYEWEVLLKPGRRVAVGDEIVLGDIRARVIGKGETVRILADRPKSVLLDFAQEHGEIPIPPYVRDVPERLEDYQTVYARETGSVAAPTAGFHFTHELLQKVADMGVIIQYVTLHVGLGTFRPMKTLTIEEHTMHSEFVTIPSQTARAINAAKREGRRVIAVGTTTVRTLEGVARSSAIHNGGSRSCLPEEGFSGDLNLFITPGFAFRIIDGFITNFHLPKSTLLVLVSAFAGREHILAAYTEAIRERYRFFSFGDAMFIRA